MLQSAGGLEWLRYLVLILILGNILALVIGLMMTFAPQRLQAWLAPGGAWTSMRRLTKPLEIMREADATMLKYPRALGALLLAGAVFILVKGGLFVSEISGAQGGRMLARFFSGTTLAPPAWEMLWASAMLLILIGALAALAVGVLSAFKAETLRGWSALMNRWVSTRQAVKPAARPYYVLDEVVRHRPRVWGGVITLAAVYTLLMLAWFARGA